jgi:uncharacterized protein with GYD domain
LKYNKNVVTYKTLKINAMQTFILLTKLSQELATRIGNREEIGKSWLMAVKEKCPKVKFIAHYAILGQYDFLDIYEAPDIETAAKVSMVSRQNGASHAESLPAIEYKRYVDLVSEL